MSKYYFNVSLNGSFLFRTEADDDARRNSHTERVLVTKFKAASGYRITRNEIKTSCSFTDITHP